MSAVKLTLAGLETFLLKHILGKTLSNNGAAYCFEIIQISHLLQEQLIDKDVSG